jgi:primosomal protein N' (replication factor Y)
VNLARVVPDVTGLDKQFDYLVPEHLRPRVQVGTKVRIPLHGRRVGGWVVALDPPDAPISADRLVPLAAVSSVGPPPDVVELAHWAATRWGAPRVRPFLVVASPPVMVPALSASRRTVVPRETDPGRGGVHCLAPLSDPLPHIIELLAAGPAIVVHPAPAAARAVASRLRKAGFSVALLPDEWAHAAAGVDVVVGSRGAVWAPCPDVRSIVVLDEHDESLQDERTPTWHARDVAIERARRAGARCVLFSPCPTVTAVQWAGDEVRRPSTLDATGGWPFIDVVDRSDTAPWARSLVSSPLIAHLRAADRRVVCVLNTTGRARLLACRSCRALQRCTRCDAAVSQAEEGVLACGRCGETRPYVCAVCGSSALSNVKPGVTRLREELEAAANRPVVAVTGDSGPLPAADVYVGTEAVLHRVRDVDIVCFLDADAELLAPRYRAGEQFMALLVRAGRLVGSRARGGVVMVQTYVPHHPVLQAAVLGDPSRLWDDELAHRRMLGLPPFHALGQVDGADALEFVGATGLEFATTAKGAIVRADTWQVLGAAFARTSRPKGSRLRVVVDPPRA